MKRTHGLLALILLTPFIPITGTASIGTDDVLALTYENDVFGGSDKYYTNGIQLTWSDQLDDLTPPEERIAFLDWMSFLPFYADEGDLRYNTYGIGQIMMTPSNINLTTPIRNDRPYAGWLYASALFSRASDNSLATLGIQMGIVGPDSYAGDIQRGVHHIASDAIDPKGWDNQLPNRFAFLLSYQQTWRVFAGESGSWAWDVLPNVGGAAGNTYVQFGAGAMGRIGWRLNKGGFGPGAIRPNTAPLAAPRILPLDEPEGWRFWVFGGAQGLAVAYNMFLTESSTGAGADITREPYVGYGQIGFTVAYNWLQFSYTQKFQTSEFSQQPSGQWSGALTIGGQF